MLLMIDNYDSFTYNLVQYLGELGENLVVYRNDKISIDDIEKMKPDRIVVSPGPCTPKEAGISVATIRKFAGHCPILGVCLGHQSIGAAYGARIVGARRLMHGKTSEIRHDGKTLFADLPDPFVATRYHSLVIERDSLSPEFEISAESEDGEIMGIRHRDLPLEGVQFHPESILTTVGKDLLKNFLKIGSA
jgi:anthranilate synthase/aminodeoxychorismate synthase-like glutamine amidotransferase